MKAIADSYLISFFIVITGLNLGRTQNKHQNVFFIAIDDLHPFGLACYGSPIIMSPAINSLASQGILFKKH